MLEPNGPLPPEIYWRRRALAIVGGLVVVGLVIWLIVAVGGGSSSDDTSAAAASSSLTTTPAPSTSESDSTDASGQAGAGDGSGGSGSESVSGSATSSGAAAPVPAGQCPDQSLAVKASPDQPTYATGAQPGFTIVVTNIGTTACERDLGSGLQQVLVYTLENQRLWSNVDCFPSTTPDIRTLKPGEQAPFTVTWSATTSEPGCTAPRNPVAPGAYSVVGQLGELRSAPEPFNIT